MRLINVSLNLVFLLSVLWVIVQLDHVLEPEEALSLGRKRFIWWTVTNWNSTLFLLCGVGAKHNVHHHCFMINICYIDNFLAFQCCGDY
jgi:hypothetical protein